MPTRQQTRAIVYVSIDVETSGPIPGPHFLMALGAVAFDEAGREIAAFSRNLGPLPGSDYDPDTLKWWQSEPDAHREATRDAERPEAVTRDLLAWLKALPGKPVAVGYPILFDGMWVHWYLMRFCGENPMSHAGIDVRTLAWAKLGGTYGQASKPNMPQAWFDGLPAHTHRAEDDAREQGLLFFNIRRAEPAGG